MKTNRGEKKKDLITQLFDILNIELFLGIKVVIAKGIEGRKQICLFVYLVS